MIGRFILKIVLLVGITVGPLLALNYLVDPLQCFRSAKWYKPLYDSNERVQSACLARSHNYDTVIAGSSHVENIAPVFVDDTFGVSSVRLTIAASTLYEQNQVLNLALNRGKVKKVIWGLDTNILYDEPTRVREDIVPFPFYIYQPSFLNDLLFLLDPYQIKHYAKMVVHRLTGKYGEFTDLRRLNSWDNLFTFSEERVWQAYQAVRGGKMLAMQNTNEKLAVDNLNNLPTENIDENVVKLVKNNSDVRFVIYFPPYSVLRWVQLYENDRQKFDAELKLKEYLTKELLGQSNVSIFDFQAVKEVTYNLDNYKDLTHYSGAVDKHILADLLAGRHQLKDGEENNFLNQLRTQIENFDFSALKK